MHGGFFGDRPEERLQDSSTMRVGKFGKDRPVGPAGDFFTTEVTEDMEVLFEGSSKGWENLLPLPKLHGSKKSRGSASEDRLRRIGNLHFLRALRGRKFLGRANWTILGEHPVHRKPSLPSLLHGKKLRGRAIARQPKKRGTTFFVVPPS